MQKQFVALVPVKALDAGKSRLIDIPAPERRAPALAFARDTLVAVMAAPSVARTVVVTSDPELAGAARSWSCEVLADTGGLNDSLRSAAAQVGDSVVVAVCADLPALTPDDLEAALAQHQPGAGSYVADHVGTGTTAYAAPVGVFDPQFGPGSALAHRAAGARPVVGDLPSLRRDVDTLEDLMALSDHGLLGSYTCAVLAATSLPCPG